MPWPSARHTGPSQRLQRCTGERAQQAVHDPVRYSPCRGDGKPTEQHVAQVAHEYLISQVQFTGDESVAIAANTMKSTNVRLNFNHPTKFIAWVQSGAQHGQWTGGPLGSTAEAFSPLASAKLQLNGHDRFASRSGSYFNKVQPFQTCGTHPIAGLSMYSFALRPAEHQPSGQLGLSGGKQSPPLVAVSRNRCDTASCGKPSPERATTTPGPKGAARNRGNTLFPYGHNVARTGRSAGERLRPPSPGHDAASETPRQWAPRERRQLSIRQALEIESGPARWQSAGAPDVQLQPYRQLHPAALIQVGRVRRYPGHRHHRREHHRRRVHQPDRPPHLRGELEYIGFQK